MIRNRLLFDADPPAGFDGVFFWDFLKGAFDQCEPMDLDAVVERRGHLLTFETKEPWTHVPSASAYRALEDRVDLLIGTRHFVQVADLRIPQGQYLTLKSIVREKRWTVVFCAKRCDQIHGWLVVTRESTQRMIGDATALKAWCSMWNDNAKAHPLW